MVSGEEIPQIQYLSPKEALGRGESPQHRLDLFVDGEKIGSAEIDYFSRPLPLYQLSDLCILFEHHSKGYGSQIMDQVEAWLKKKKKPGVLVDAIDADAPAYGMYERRGWKRIPDSSYLYVFNWPEGVSLDVLKGYAFQYTDPMERKSWFNRNKSE